MALKDDDVIIRNAANDFPDSAHFYTCPEACLNILFLPWCRSCLQMPRHPFDLDLQWLVDRLQYWQLVLQQGWLVFDAVASPGVLQGAESLHT